MQPSTPLQRLFRYLESFSSVSDPIIPPLLALPTEILCQINDYTVGTSDPTLAILRRTHRVFYQLIPPADVRSSATKKELAQQLRAAQDRYSFLFPPGHLAYFTCLYVKPESSFADDKGAQRAKWGLKSHGRYCLKCGIVNGEYRKPGMCIRIQGIAHHLCRGCLKLYPVAETVHVCYPDRYPLGMLAVSSAVFLILLPLLNPPQPLDIILPQPSSTYRKNELCFIVAAALQLYYTVPGDQYKIGRL